MALPQSRQNLENKKHSVESAAEGLTSPVEQSQAELLILERDFLEEKASKRFLPSHSSSQLISPRAFFTSALFRVSSKSVPRQKYVELSIGGSAGKGEIFFFRGPELRQKHSQVFMTLLNLLKDEELGNKASFNPEDLCRRILDGYSGPSRSKLKELIGDLQRSLVTTGSFSVQLCKRFDHPSKGKWSIELDPDLVEIFKSSSHVWIKEETFKRLPVGLATWLYGYVEAQVRLTPTKVQKLCEQSGSNAEISSFTKILKRNLSELENCKVIRQGWRIKDGVVYWSKA